MHLGGREDKQQAYLCRPPPAMKQRSPAAWEGAMLTVNPTPGPFSLSFSYLALYQRKGEAEEGNKSSS